MVPLAHILGLAMRGDLVCNSTLAGRNRATPSKFQNLLTESQTGLRKIKVVPTTFAFMEINQWKTPRAKYISIIIKEMSYSIQQKGRRSTYVPISQQLAMFRQGGGVQFHIISNNMGILAPYQDHVVHCTWGSCLLLETPVSGISPALCPFWLRYLREFPKALPYDSWALP